MPSRTFHLISGMTSPVGALFNGLVAQFSAGAEFGSVVTQPQRRRLLGGLFDSCCADQADKQVAFDTNRLWSAKLPALLDLLPRTKVIACVRNVSAANVIRIKNNA